MPAMVSALGVGVAAAFIVLSALMNWSYGVSRGTGDLDRWLLGAVSVSADLYKAIGLFFIGWAIKHRRLWVWWLAVLAWLLVVIYGFASAFGYASLSRVDAARRGEDRGAMYRSIKAELGRKEQRRAEIGAVEADAVVDARLIELKAQAFWRETRECRTQRTAAQAAFCSDTRRVQKDRVVAGEAERLDGEITALRNRLAMFASASVAGDPQGDLIGQLTGFDLRTVATSLVLLLVVLVEVMSGAGLYIALGHGEPLLWRATAMPPAAPPVGGVARFACVATREEAEVETDLDVLFVAYADWCRATGQMALSRVEFEEHWKILAHEVGWHIDGSRVSEIKVADETVAA